MRDHTHISILTHLLQSSPMVTEEQAAWYIAQKQKISNLGGIYRSIHIADSNKLIWREHVPKQDTILLASNPRVAADKGVKQFPYAFWLYLAAKDYDRPCETGEYPFCASFSKRRKDGSDRTAQIAVLDMRERMLPLTLAIEVQKYTRDFCREWLRNEGPEILPSIFWRALIVLHVSNDFLTSRDFEQLQGVGFSSFFASNGYNTPPKLLAKQSDEAVAWGKLLHSR